MYAIICLLLCWQYQVCGVKGIVMSSKFAVFFLVFSEMAQYVNCKVEGFFF